MILWIIATVVSSVQALAPPRILVVGGNGRVGGSTAKWLHLLSRAENRPVDLILGGRSAENFKASRARILDQLKGEQETTKGQQQPPVLSFQQIDLDSGVANLKKALETGFIDCVVHTAGPFQQRTNPELLKACVARGLPYVDVCDEVELCKAAKELQVEAAHSGCVAVVAGGIWPGASALMAAEAVAELRRMEQESQQQQQRGEGSGGDNVGHPTTTAPSSPPPLPPCVNENVDMSFFTAGTGNAGATIVSATFLLLCSPVLTFVQGCLVEQEPWGSPREVDFGKGVGRRVVRLLDNPDVFTVHAALKVPNLTSRFATAPGIWNQLFGAMKAAVPASVLSNKQLMQGLSVFSLPIIRAVDKLVGATNAMRVDVSGGEFGHRVRFQATHEDLEQCVGLATAAFALEVLFSSSGNTSSSSSSSGGGSSVTEGETSDAAVTTQNRIPPGVYFPADLPARARAAILDRVKADATLWEFESIRGDNQ